MASARSSQPAFLPAERWVNAKIEVLIPLDVPVDADPYVKQEAVSAAIETLSLPRNAVARGEWEDCKVEAEELPTIPAPPRVPGQEETLDQFVGVRAGRSGGEVFWRAVCEPCGFVSSPVVDKDVARSELRRHAGDCDVVGSGAHDVPVEGQERAAGDEPR